MSDITRLAESLPVYVKDVKLNLTSVLGGNVSTLTLSQKWGCALAVAYSLKSKKVIDAFLGSSLEAEHITREVVEDAHAAAALMAMNNVYYRFKHLVGKEAYETRPARLRMTRIASPATSKLDFEMMCLAVSAVNGCGACMSAHEKVVLDGGSSEDAVHDVVRVASIVASVVVAADE